MPFRTREPGEAQEACPEHGDGRSSQRTLDYEKVFGRSEPRRRATSGWRRWWQVFLNGVDE